MSDAPQGAGLPELRPPEENPGTGSWGSRPLSPDLLGLTPGGSRTTAAPLPHLSDGTSRSTAGTGIRFWAGVATSAPLPHQAQESAAAVPLGRSRRKRRLVWTSRRGGDGHFLPRGPAPAPPTADETGRRLEDQTSHRNQKNQRIKKNQRSQKNQRNQSNQKNHGNQGNHKNERNQKNHKNQRNQRNQTQQADHLEESTPRNVQEKRGRGPKMRGLIM